MCKTQEQMEEVVENETGNGGQFLRIPCSIPKNLDFILETNGLQGGVHSPKSICKIIPGKTRTSIYIYLFSSFHILSV